MMRPILSNDDEDWHSHLEPSVKESGLDWQRGFFVIGDMAQTVATHPGGAAEPAGSQAGQGFATYQRIA
ncbi:hypothetical protein [Burkholderia anthina]|uniref:hypothetical protein n=1 Tax=Burkholderia anthina TaxID=179879 RepID=UPI00158A8B79|nr:hypothetical protein [Burkholderia anthina]